MSGTVETVLVAITLVSYSTEMSHLFTSHVSHLRFVLQVSHGFLSCPTLISYLTLEYHVAIK